MKEVVTITLNQCQQNPINKLRLQKCKYKHWVLCIIFVLCLVVDWYWFFFMPDADILESRGGQGSTHKETQLTCCAKHSKCGVFIFIIYCMIQLSRAGTTCQHNQLRKLVDLQEMRQFVASFIFSCYYKNIWPDLKSARSVNWNGKPQQNNFYAGKSEKKENIPGPSYLKTTRRQWNYWIII